MFYRHSIQKYVNDEEEANSIEINTLLLEGNAGEEIVDFAKSNYSDLITPGTRDRTGINPFLVAIVAENVV